jgi:hypothetical protein
MQVATLAAAGAPWWPAAGMDLRTTLVAIRAVAERRRFTTYGLVAAANGLSWRQARRRIDPHLFALCRWARERDWPLLSALVVDRPALATGAMTGRPLVGFVRAAERLGCVGAVALPAAEFLRREQELVFDWAERERGRDLHH